MVGFWHCPSELWCGFNFVLNTGQKSYLSYNQKAKPEKYLETKIDSDVEVRKVVISGINEIACIEFFDISGELLIQVGRPCLSFDNKKREFFLSLGERIIGVRSRKSPNGAPRHEDIVFLIGIMEPETKD